MISLNKAMIIGNITRDPELRYIPNGQAVCNFSVATNRRYKNATGETVEEVQYHDVVAWGKLAELINQILAKGNKVYVDGRLQTRQWDAPDGSKRSRTEIVMEQFVPLTPKGVGNFNETSLNQDVNTQDTNQDAQDQTKPITKKQPSKTKPADVDQSQPQDDEINLDDIPF